MTAREEIGRADSHARAMAHRFGFNSLDAKDARDEAQALRERVWQDGLRRDRDQGKRSS